MATKEQAQKLGTGAVEGTMSRFASAVDLGEPMTIAQVAALLGCSAWTVRQRYLPRGLPHFRSCHAGKLVFFRGQVIQWILQQQLEKGGNR